MGISYNKSILVGRLVGDPAQAFSKNGMQITKATIAVDRQKKKDGTQETDFIRIVAFGKTAEFMTKYFNKGSLIMVEGRIQVSKYQADDGSNRYSTDIIVDNVRFMETKRNAEQNTTQRPYNNDEVITNDEAFDAPGDSGDDEVPF